jgi:hypothetical protein
LILACPTALAILELTMGSGGSPAIAWQVAPEHTCPTVAQLEEAFARLPAATPPEGLTDHQILAEVDATNGVVTLSLSVPQTELSERREIDVGKSPCKEIAQTIAIMAHAWLEHLPSLNSGTAMSEQAHAPTIAMSSSTTPSAIVHVEGQSVSSSSSLGLTLRLAADLVVAPGAGAAPAIALDAELQVAREIGVGLLASWIGNLTADDAPYGSIVVQQQIFGASAAWLIGEVGVRGLSAALLGALVLWHGTAQSFGYPMTTTEQLLEPGILAAARLDQEIGGPLFLEAQISMVALVRSLSLQVNRPEAAPVTVAQIPWFALAVGVGFGVKIF